MTVEVKPGDLIERMRRLMEIDVATLPPDGGPRFNRLIFAASPYLLQHADNPVDWYPWGEEAFALAREEDKPVFLSIGYATCHWCHVMEAESFENMEVAQVLNRHYVAIKVDREERPDIDEQFMTVARLMTGSGGWPLNIVMTPDRKPFFAATYLPVEPRSGMPGIVQVLVKLADLWRAERGRLTEHGANVMAALARQVKPAAGTLPAGGIFREGTEQLAAMFDPEWGGFGGAPKFPMPIYLMFLLRAGRRSGDPVPLAMVEHTLRMLRFGGIYDQLGFGIHRYAVDREWLVPHFEKMLYDQALVATAALETFQVTGDRFFQTMAEEIFTFVLREMTSPEGGFYAGLDADSEGEEGRYYLWTKDEIREVLGEQAAARFRRLFDVTERGNFEEANILHLPLPPDAFAVREGIGPDLLNADLARWRELLLAARERRTRPFRDEKVLTAWSGLMIAAFAKGFAVTREERYLTAADRGRRFIRERLLTSEGRLLRSYHRREGNVPAFLEDYAFFVRGLLNLYAATLNRAYLDEARRFTDDMLRLFGDEEEGGLYDAAVGAGEVLIRQKSADDGVIPSGNSVAAMNLLELGRHLRDDRLAAEGERLLRAFMGSATKQPAAHLHLLSAYDYLLDPTVEVTLVGPREDAATAAMLQAVGQRFIPGLVLRHAEAGEGGLEMIADATTAYVCAKGGCRPPVADARELAKLLDELG